MIVEAKATATAKAIAKAKKIPRRTNNIRKRALGRRGSYSEAGVKG